MAYSLSQQYTGGIRLSRLPGKLTEAPLADVAASVVADRPVLFTGTVGTGKTTLMAEIDFWTETRNTALRIDPNRPFPTFFGDEPWPLRFNLWTSAAEYCDDVKFAFGKDFGCDRAAVRARRLFLDDLGVERPTPQNTDAISALIYGRYALELPTWVTTNLSASELRERYSERVFSRLFDKVLLVELTGVDRRMEAR